MIITLINIDIIKKIIIIKIIYKTINNYYKRINNKSKH